jgi:hypothetical protein
LCPLNSRTEEEYGDLLELIEWWHKKKAGEKTLRPEPLEIRPVFKRKKLLQGA